MSDPKVLTATEAEAALRAIVRELHMAGRVRGCRMLSEGSACDCMLCLIDLIADRNQPETIALRAEVERLTQEVLDNRDVIANWMRVNAEIAAVSFDRKERLHEAEAALAAMTAERDAILTQQQRLAVLEGLALGTETR